MTRLIDADALKKVFAEYGGKAKFTNGACQQLIDNAPPVERPTGRWLRTDDMYETLVCSECDYDTGDYDRHNFCPNCGADMRKGEEEHGI